MSVTVYFLLGDGCVKLSRRTPPACCSSLYIRPMYNSSIVLFRFYIIHFENFQKSASIILLWYALDHDAARDTMPPEAGVMKYYFWRHAVQFCTRRRGIKAAKPGCRYEWSLSDDACDVSECMLPDYNRKIITCRDMKCRRYIGAPWQRTSGAYNHSLRTVTDRHMTMQHRQFTQTRFWKRSCRDAKWWRLDGGTRYQMKKCYTQSTTI